MRSDIKAMALVICATLGSACSSPARVAESAVGTAPRPQPAPQAVAVASGTPATASAAPGDVDLVKAGYSVMRRHGQVLYCRNEIITGGRIATRICLTAAQIQAEKQDVAKAKDLMNDHYNRCMGPECTS
jgi:hypothetical protein